MKKQWKPTVSPLSSGLLQPWICESRTGSALRIGFISTLLGLILLLSACETPKQVVYVSGPPPKMPQLSAEISTPIQTNFLCLIEKYLYGSQAVRTELLNNLKAASNSTMVSCESTEVPTK